MVLKDRVFLKAGICTSMLLATLFVCWHSSKANQGSDKGEAATSDRITVSDLQRRLAAKEPIVIIDVRGSDYDSSDSKIKGAIRIPPAEIKQHLAELPRDREIVAYCSCPTDGGSLNAVRVLSENGFKHVRALRGGWPAWKKAGGAVEPK